MDLSPKSDEKRPAGHFKGQQRGPERILSCPDDVGPGALLCQATDSALFDRAQCLLIPAVGRIAEGIVTRGCEGCEKFGSLWLAIRRGMRYSSATDPAATSVDPTRGTEGPRSLVSTSEGSAGHGSCASRGRRLVGGCLYGHLRGSDVPSPTA